MSPPADQAGPIGRGHDGADDLVVVPEADGSFARRVLRRAQRVRTIASRSERSRRIVMALALVAFVGMGVLALRAYPDDVPQSPNWWLLVAVGAIGSITTNALNLGEFLIQGRMVGRRIPLGEGIRTTILATAANLLPIPGSMVVRTRSLAVEAGYRAAIRSTTIAGATWLLATAVLAGVAMLLLGLVLVGVALVVGGLVGLAACAVFVQSMVEDWRRVFGMLLVVETATAVVGGARLFGILIALGLDVNIGQAVALTLSGVIAAATGIFPSGLGVREAVAAGIASVVDLPASVGFVATAADRIAGLAVLSVLSAIILLRSPRVRDTPDTTDPSSAVAIAGYYNEYSTWYDEERRYGYYGLINDLEIEKIDVQDHERVLEVGCGTGLLLERTTAAARFAVGVDLSPGMAAVSTAKGLRVANASVTQLPFCDAAFDVVYSCKVLPHVPDIAAGLQEIRRVVRPGGRMLLEFYNPVGLKRLAYALRWRGRREEPVYVRFDSVEAIRSILPAGVELDSVRGTRTFGPSRHFYTAPLIGRITGWLDRRFCDAWPGRRFGGYLLLELRDRRAD